MRAAAPVLMAMALTACSSSGAPVQHSTPPPFTASSKPVARLPRDVQQLKLDGTPIGIAVDGHTAWVVLAGFDKVVAVHLGTSLEKGRTYRAGKTPLRAVTASDGLWVTSFGNGRLLRVGAKPLAIEAGDQPEGLARTGDDALWVVDQQNGRVLRFAPGTRKLTGTAEVGVEPRLVGAAGTGVVVSSFGDGTITAVDKTLHARTSKPLCTGAQGVAVHGNTIAVACTGSDEVVLADRATLRPTARVRLHEPDALAYTGNGTLLVGEQLGPSVVAVSGTTVGCRVTVGVQPDVSDANVGLAVLPDGGAVLTSPDVDGFYRVPGKDLQSC